MFRSMWCRFAVLLILLLWPFAFTQAEVTENGLVYGFSSGNVKITGYTGDEEELIIPAQIEGLPVVEVVLAYHDGTQWVPNFTTKKVVLPETVKVLGACSFYQYYELAEIEGLEHVQVLAGSNFEDTSVTELIFSERLDRMENFAIGSCAKLKKIRIPDDVVLNVDFSYGNFHRYNFALEKIELIETGNPPTLTLDGPVLYTADMKTLVAHPAADSNCSYRIPEGVEELACFAFSLIGGYRTEGLQDVVIPRSMKKVYTNSFFSPDNGEMVMPYMHVYSDSPLRGYAESMGYLYRLRDDGTVTVSDRVQQIVDSVVTSGMTDYEKAYRLNRWLVENCKYDDSFSNHTAFYLLMYGTGVCQSYMLTYEMLLDQVGIPNYQYIVWIGGGHGFNAVRIDGEWCYVDTTWNAADHDLYFGMNADIVAGVYGVSNSFDQYADGQNTGYKNYSLYRQGVYTEFFREASEYLQSLLDQGEKKITITEQTLNDQLLSYPVAGSAGLNIDMALLAAYWRDCSFACTEPIHIKFNVNNQAIAVHVGEDVSDYDYSLYEDGICIDAYTGTDERINIPSEIDGLPVLAIGDTAFRERTDITEVVIPENVEVIGVRAFQGCTALSKVSLPNSLKTIKEIAFAECSALKEISLPEGLTRIEHQVFQECSALTSIRLPDRLEFIGGSLFYACSSLKDVGLPSNLTMVPGYMFGRCTSLQELELPDGVNRIEEGAFSDCCFATIALPPALEYIGQYAFLNSAIETLVLPASMKEIGYGAFNGSQIKNIVLNEGLETIGEEAFYNSRLESILLPASLTTLGTGCFGDCRDLSDVHVSAGSECFTIHAGILYTEDMSELVFSPVSTSGVVKIPASVTTIRRNAFSYNSQVTEIIFRGDRLTELGESAFSDCSSLERISIPSGVKTLPYSCFLRCTALRELELPDTLTAIETWALHICPNLKQIDLPDGITEIGESVFAGSGITALRLPRGMTAVPDNLLANTCVDTLYVHSGVTYIGLNNLFGYPGTVYGIPGTYAEAYAEEHGYTFVADQSVWHRLVLPSGLLTIDEEAFMNTQVDMVVIPDGCTAIGARAFAVCENLRYAHVPATITAIGEGAFDGDVTLVVSKDSYAARWAEEHGIRTEY